MFFGQANVSNPLENVEINDAGYASPCDYTEGSQTLHAHAVQGSVVSIYQTSLSMKNSDGQQAPEPAHPMYLESLNRIVDFELFEQNDAERIQYGPDDANYQRSPGVNVSAAGRYGDAAGK